MINCEPFHWPYRRSTKTIECSKNLLISCNFSKYRKGMQEGRRDYWRRDYSKGRRDSWRCKGHLSSRWSPKIGEHIAVNFDDGLHIGGVNKILDDNTVVVSYMKPKKVLTANPSEHPWKFWIWPYSELTQPTNRQCILNLRPAELILAIPWHLQNAC